jgi:hypothetical protein
MQAVVSPREVDRPAELDHLRATRPGEFSSESGSLPWRPDLSSHLLSRRLLASISFKHLHFLRSGFLWRQLFTCCRCVWCRPRPTTERVREGVRTAGPPRCSAPLCQRMITPSRCLLTIASSLDSTIDANERNRSSLSRSAASKCLRSVTSIPVGVGTLLSRPVPNGMQIHAALATVG